MKRLTDLGYWDSTYWGSARPQRLKFLYRDMDYEFVRLLRRYGQGSGTKTLELGAGGSRMLPYLERKFQYQTLGTDFSLVGCRLLQANYSLAGSTGRVICEDLFSSSLKAGSFDLIFSFGLIEHFDETRAALEAHLRLLRPGGALVVTVPNLVGLYGHLMKRLAASLWARHKTLTRKDLRGYLTSLGLEGVVTGYLGSFYAHLGTDADWTGVQRWPQPLRFLLPLMTRTANGLLSLFFRLLPYRPHCRLTSPTIFAVGVKPDSNKPKEHETRIS